MSEINPFSLMYYASGCASAPALIPLFFRVLYFRPFWIGLNVIPLFFPLSARGACRGGMCPLPALRPPLSSFPARLPSQFLPPRWVVDPRRGAEGVVGIVGILFHRASLFLLPPGYWAPAHPIRRCDGGGVRCLGVWVGAMGSPMGRLLTMSLPSSSDGDGSSARSLWSPCLLATSRFSSFIGPCGR